MNRRVPKKVYTCFVFGEGKKDKDFLKTLIDLPKFKFHTSKWIFNYSNASGGSAGVILEKCDRETFSYRHDLILCFIDLGDLKNDFPITWREEKSKLERQYPDFKIIWQLDNAEDEYKKVLGNIDKRKHVINKLAKLKVNQFINSDFWKRILEPIKSKEKELEKNDG